MFRPFKFAFLIWFLLSAASARAQDLRAEVIKLDYGAELITILTDESDGQPIPLISILRDTLGDGDPENDMLRYVWVMTYARPGLLQRILSLIPFFYHGSKSKGRADGPPPPLLDLANAKQQSWRKALLLAVQNLSLDRQGPAFKLMPRAGTTNHYNYKGAQVALALSVIALYRQAAEGRGDRVITEAEWRQVQSQLLNQHPLGFLLDDQQLDELYRRERRKSYVNIARNWELLRQRAEEEHLYFEPLLEGLSQHVVLWVAREDVNRFHGRKDFNPRFLKIKSPWSDETLLDWSGYTKTIYLDDENRRVSPEHAQARKRELIPLAVYGLDSPHLPLLLIDFRSPAKPRKHEVSKRAAKDLIRYVTDITYVANIQYSLTKKLLNLIAGRKGLTFALAPAFRSYAQLKLALLLDDSIDPAFRRQMLAALDRAQVNPLTNGVESEIKLAREQYLRLLEYAVQADGLKEKLERDREWDMTTLRHGRKSFIFKLARYASLGTYRHREGDFDGSANYGLARKLRFHSKLLKQVARQSQAAADDSLDVCWDKEMIKRSLQMVALHGDVADKELVAALDEIYSKSKDPEIKLLSYRCLLALNGSPKEKTSDQQTALSGSE